MAMDPLDLYLHEITRRELLTDKETRMLARKAQKGHADALATLTEANLRLVVNVAKQYLGCGLCLQDLIAEGNIGLMQAVKKYDPSRENTFSTYAVWWIKQSIRKALTNTARPVRIPSYMRQIIGNWRDVAAKLEEEQGQPPSLGEIVDALEVPPQNRDAVERAILASDGLSRSVSFDEGEKPDDIDHDYRHGFSKIDDESGYDLERIRHLVDRLDGRRATIIRLRYGLDGEAPMTLQEVAEVVGLTRERVRQIEKESMTKLRNWAERQAEFVSLCAAG